MNKGFISQICPKCKSKNSDLIDVERAGIGNSEWTNYYYKCLDCANKFGL